MVERIEWLLKGDVSIQYQAYRDLLTEERDDLREPIAKEGWTIRQVVHHVADSQMNTIVRFKLGTNGRDSDHQTLS